MFIYVYWSVIIWYFQPGHTISSTIQICNTIVLQLYNLTLKDETYNGTLLIIKNWIIPQWHLNTICDSQHGWVSLSCSGYWCNLQNLIFFYMVLYIGNSKIKFWHILCLSKSLFLFIGSIFSLCTQEWTDEPSRSSFMGKILFTRVLSSRLIHSPKWSLSIPLIFRAIFLVWEF